MRRLGGLSRTEPHSSKTGCYGGNGKDRQPPLDVFGEHPSSSPPNGEKVPGQFNHECLEGVDGVMPDEPEEIFHGFL